MPACTKDPIEDIGHGVRIERRHMDGKLADGGIAYWHPRPDGTGECEGWVSFKPHWAEGWDLVSERPLTLTPSLLCTACGHHGFIRDGRWVPA